LRALCKNQKGQRVLIAAHGNSLRALVKYLDNMSDADIMALNIPTGMNNCLSPLLLYIEDWMASSIHWFQFS